MVNEAVESYLRNTLIPLRLAILTPTEWPMVVSLWYIYKEGLLYCATHRKARVVQYLQTEPRCGFEIAAEQPPYSGVRGRGIARVEPHLGPEILRELLVRYQGSTETPLAQQLLLHVDREVAIVIEPGMITRWDEGPYTQRAAYNQPGLASR